MKKSATQRAPMMESLEGRQLLSGSHSVSATKLTFSTDQTSGTIANPISHLIAAKITSNGLPLRSAVIDIVIDGTTSIGEGTSSRSGYVTLNVPGVFAGTHTIEAVFSGALRYAKSVSKQTSATITVPSLTTTSDGLEYATITAGTGATAASGNTIQANYVGYLTTGTLFDTSIGRAPTPGDTTDFTVDGGYTLTTQLGSGGTIVGFDEGITGMKVGETRLLVIPSSIGYGSEVHGSIPANSTLVFYVKLEAISS